MSARRKVYVVDGGELGWYRADVTLRNRTNLTVLLRFRGNRGAGLWDFVTDVTEL